MVYITETKLSKDVQVIFKEQGYNVWRKGRRGKAGGGVSIMAQEDIYLEKVQ